MSESTPSDRVKELFFEVLDAEPEDVTAFVRQQCAGDQELGDRVLALIAAHEQAGQVMPMPVDATRAERVVPDADPEPSAPPRSLMPSTFPEPPTTSPPTCRSSRLETTNSVTSSSIGFKWKVLNPRRFSTG